MCYSLFKINSYFKTPHSSFFYFRLLYFMLLYIIIVIILCLYVCVWMCKGVYALQDITIFAQKDNTVFLL